MSGGKTKKFLWLCFIILIIGNILTWAGCAPNIGDENHDGNQAPTPSVIINHEIAQGTKVEDCDLSGLKEKDALAKLEEWSRVKLEQKIKLVYNETEEWVSLKDLGANLDTEKIWQDLNSHPGETVKSALYFKEIRENLESLYTTFNQKPVDASFKIENNKFNVVPAAYGTEFNYEDTVKPLKELSLAQIPEKIDVSVHSIAPKINTGEVEALGFYDLIAQYETKYNVNEANRSFNLVKAAMNFNNRLIKPNEVISFNDTVGPRTPERGYKDAYIIIDNEYVEGTGGGICQVSSTLYNAALLANLKIMERQPHAVAVAYVPLGQDATVNYPNLDFKFQNPFSHYIFLQVEVGDGVLRFKFFGQKSNHTVSIVHEVEKEVDFKVENRYDPSLGTGKRVVEQKGTKGYTVSTYKVIQPAQGEAIKELISKDVYQPSNKIVKVGPRRIR